MAAQSTNPLAGNQLRIGILGASGYTGVELVRLLVRHPNASIALMTANSHAGKTYDAVFPHLGGNDLPTLIRTEEASWDGIDSRLGSALRRLSSAFSLAAGQEE